MPEREGDCLRGVPVKRWCLVGLLWAAGLPVVGEPHLGAPPVVSAVATGDASAAVAGKGGTVKELRSGAWSPELTSDERQTLFAIALDTLAWSTGSTRGSFLFDGYTLTESLRRPMATFVTLEQGGMLRGCIGSLAPEAPLYMSVHENAFNAAQRDPRFRPVTAAEVADLEVRVSILSPIREIGSWGEFRIGEHGIIIEKHGRRAVYLPEVAPEQGWDVEETLSSLSLKAGLPPDAWKEGARFRVFSSVVLVREGAGES